MRVTRPFSVCCNISFFVWVLCFTMVYLSFVISSPVGSDQHPVGSKAGTSWAGVGSSADSVPGSSQSETSRVKIEGYLPSKLDVGIPSMSLHSAAQELPRKLQMMGYEHAAVEIAISVPRHLQMIQSLVLNQIKTQPDKLQFLPVLHNDDGKIYAMALDQSSRKDWPKELGHIAGDHGATKAAVIGVSHAGQGVPTPRGIRLYGIVDIKQATNLHEPLPRVLINLRDARGILLP